MNVDIKKYEQLLRASIDAKLSTMDSTFSNSIGLKLSKSKLLIWLNEPSSIILNNDFKAQIEQIITAVLYPYWIVKHKAGLTLVPRWGEPAESARALSYDLHFGIYKRLEVDKLSSTNLFENAKHEVKIALMDDFFWCPDGTSNSPSVPDLAIEAITRNGKTTLLRYLIVNCDGYAKIKVKNGAIDDNFASIIVIDPKLDADLRATTISINGKYIAPDFSKSDINYLDQVNTQLKEIIDLMRSRAERRKLSPNLKFKDVFLTIDEAISLPTFGNSKTKNIYMGLLDKILMMGAAFQIHVLMASQSFLVGAQGALSSQARLEFGAKILLANKITPENTQFLFKDLDAKSINNLILDTDSHGLTGVGICDFDGNIVPFKAPFFHDLGAPND